MSVSVCLSVALIVCPRGIYLGHTGRSDVTEPMVTIRSPFWGDTWTKLVPIQRPVMVITQRMTSLSGEDRFVFRYFFVRIKCL